VRRYCEAVALAYGRHRSHYRKTGRHPQKGKYIAYDSAAMGGPGNGRRQCEGLVKCDGMRLARRRI